MSLAACIMRWPSTTRCPWCSYGLGGELALEHGPPGFLELEDEWVAGVALEEDDEGTHADASDADHFVGDVHDAVAPQQPGMGVGE
jgi:hypothetical protein